LSQHPFNCVYIDLEIHPEENRILKVGAWDPGKECCFYRSGKFDPAATARELLDFISDHDFIVGHNIIEYDWSSLCDLDQSFEALRKKLIDTLILNPLAFPANPYHRLVKDYKLQKESVNDPVEDSKQTEKLFIDQCDAFLANCTLSGIYGLLLNRTSPAFSHFFHLLLHGLPNNQEVNTYLSQHGFSSERLCRTSLKPLLPTLGSNNAKEQRAFAYALAWLSIAGTNSVLPAWVRHQHPELADILHQLRNKDCGDKHCSFCRKHHHLETNLETFFGYKQFRSFGGDSSETEPLQRRIVASVVQGQPTLAILPTGGGKSLCYQLPAMMLARNRGQLTIIISPLQSLMNDQVTQLQQRGYTYVASLNSSLNMLERRKVLEGIRMGDVHILFIAPEQLRNRSFIQAISSREIGQWIIDEAHCLSKWGHDFRPDYLYIGRFIRKFSSDHNQPIPPVHAFTATARMDVINEIREHFSRHLEAKLEVISGGHRRDNLSYAVLRCAQHEKRETVLTLLQQFSPKLDNGAAIIFCNRRRTTEEMAEFLKNNGFNADCFHAGLDKREKNQIQQSFMSGEIQVMAATCAFGMGVDKSNVRLVIHAQMPDSLENYLQEAGRAGRDGEPADCILLFDESDADKQFEMRRNMQIEFRDFVSLFEGIRKRARRAKEGNVSEDIIRLSSGDILRSASDSDEDAPGFDARDYSYDTKVRTAIAWMEEASLLERHENQVGVIEGTFQIHTLDLIRKQLQENNISQNNIEVWLTIAQAIMQFDNEETINIDALAQQTGYEPNVIFAAIHGLQQAGIMDHDMSLIAWLTTFTKGDSRKALSQLSELEKQLFDLIKEHAQGEDDQAFQLHLNHTCNLLRETTGTENIFPHIIMMLLGLWAKLDKLVRIAPVARGTHKLFWKKDFATSFDRIEQRQRLSDATLEHLYSMIPKGDKGKIRLPFKLGALQTALESNITTRTAAGQDELSERALLSLQQYEVLGLDSGAAIFHPAMTLQIPRNTKKPGRGAFQPLADHYQAQIRQVHLMREWAVKMADKQSHQAEVLLDDYFQMPEKKLLQKYFSESPSPTAPDALNTPASPVRLQEILGTLSDTQRRIVNLDKEQNLLVLAGPGSGKTRLIVHRVAYLVAVERVPAESILILAFNRATATELKHRLRDPLMLGNRANRLEIHTYHRLAMQLTGEMPPDNPDEFETWSKHLIPKATALLAEHDIDSEQESESLRQKLLAGFRYIFVDEYQDINEEQYALLSSLAGRTLHESEEEQLGMFAVGDDDQNIYEWNGSSNQYIHQFQDDYQAKVEFMVHNFRSCPEVVTAANQFIALHSERMKQAYPIQAVDGHGVVSLFDGHPEQLNQKAVEICQHLINDKNVPPQEIAILCRHHSDYQKLARRLRAEGLPIDIIQQDRSLPWHRLRAVHAMRQCITGTEPLSPNQIRKRWQQLDERIRTHPTCEPLWIWLDDDFEGQQDVRRSLREWRGMLYELGREINILSSHGIRVGTMHSAKGLEFDSVIVFAGNNASAKEFEPELRLRYVAMTRAKRNLYLMQRPNCSWLDQLELIPHKLTSEAKELSFEQDIITCGLGNVDLGFPGRQKRPIATSHLNEGEGLELDLEKNALIHSHEKIGALSKSFLKQLQSEIQHGWRIESVTIHAIVQRSKDESDSQYRHLHHQEEWEIIVPEIQLSRGNGGYKVNRNK